MINTCTTTCAVECSTRLSTMATRDAGDNSILSTDPDWISRSRLTPLHDEPNSTVMINTPGTKKSRQLRHVAEQLAEDDEPDQRLHERDERPHWLADGDLHVFVKEVPGIREHDGSLRVNSEDGVGACCRLPRHQSLLPDCDVDCPEALESVSGAAGCLFCCSHHCFISSADHCPHPPWAAAGAAGASSTFCLAASFMDCAAWPQGLL